MRTLYLDHASTTPLSAEARGVLLEFADSNFGNPYSLQHLVGQAAHERLEELRHAAATEFCVPAERLVLTSGATEANAMAILGFAARYRHRPHHIFVSAIEHRSVIEPAEQAARWFGSLVASIPVLPTGELALDDLRRLLARLRGPALVAVMHTNNEIPVMNPVAAIAGLCAERQAFYHCDAVQGLVRHSIKPDDLGLSSCVISAHKAYGPKGCGILILGTEERATPGEPLLTGGGQEAGRRSGTVNTISAGAGLAAIAALSAGRTSDVMHLRRCGELFAEHLQAAVPEASLTVPLSDDVPGLVSFWISGIDGNSLLNALPDVCISRGATCSTGGEKYSHVPQALGLPVEIGANVLRASFGRGCTEDDATLAVDRIAAYVRNRRR